MPATTFQVFSRLRTASRRCPDESGSGAREESLEQILLVLKLGCQWELVAAIGSQDVLNQARVHG